MVKKGTNICVKLRKNILAGTLIKNLEPYLSKFTKSKKFETACDVVPSSKFEVGNFFSLI